MLETMLTVLPIVGLVGSIGWFFVRRKIKKEGETVGELRAGKESAEAALKRQDTNALIRNRTTSRSYKRLRKKHRDSEQ